MKSKSNEVWKNIYNNRLLYVTGISKKGYLIGCLEGEEKPSEYGPSAYKRVEKALK